MSRHLAIVPAHNEEAGLPATLRSCADLDYPAGKYRVYIVADNCSDQTAELARQQGAEVSTRSDPFRRGKGYALDHGLTFLDQTGAPEVVIFLDADCAEYAAGACQSRRELYELAARQDGGAGQRL